MSEAISLIGLDWGSSHLRAFAFDSGGRVIARRGSDRGAMKLSGIAQFEQAFHDVVGDWLRANPAVRIVACGMVGARGAWVEAGYVGSNADATELARNAAIIHVSSGQRIHVVPGVKSDEPDVMRGEETQVVGANVGNGVLLLPGTHSKWVCVADGRIAEFKTCFTGELNALLRQSSSVGKVLSVAPSLEDADAISRGVARACEHRDWLHQVFLFRARVVAGQVDVQAVSSELSAWLIASEFVQMRISAFSTDAISVIASEQLLPWYVRIADEFDMRCTAVDGERCVADGLWRVAARM
jgi:2-dehydro-3-deoxygalactonokinase